MYGNVTDDKVANSVSPVKFGLNKVRLTKFAFNPNGGKDETPSDCLDIDFSIVSQDGSLLENPIRSRLYPVTKVFGEKQGDPEITDVNHPKFQEEMKNLEKTINHIVYCFITPQQKAAAFAQPVSTFKEFIDKLVSVMGDFKNVPLHLFLEYEWSLKAGQARTYLRLPKSTKHGPFVVKALDGEWTELMKPDFNTDEPIALKYVQGDMTHPFSRSGWYMHSNYAKQQSTDQSAASNSMPVVTGSDDSW